MKDASTTEVWKWIKIHWSSLSQAPHQITYQLLSVGINEWNCNLNINKIKNLKPNKTSLEATTFVTANKRCNKHYTDDLTVFLEAQPSSGFQMFSFFFFKSPKLLQLS